MGWIVPPVGGWWRRRRRQQLVPAAQTLPAASVTCFLLFPLRETKHRCNCLFKSKLNAIRGQKCVTQLKLKNIENFLSHDMIIQSFVWSVALFFYNSFNPPLCYSGHLLKWGNSGHNGPQWASMGNIKAINWKLLQVPNTHSFPPSFRSMKILYKY